jgi:hypothetical protein
MNFLPVDCFHVLLGLACGVSCTLIIGKGRIFAPLRGMVFSWALPAPLPDGQNDVPSKSPVWKRLVQTLHVLLNCQQCLGFWVGLFCGLVLFNILWGVLFAFLVSLLAVWNDLALLALMRFGAMPPSAPRS